LLIDVQNFICTVKADLLNEYVRVNCKVEYFYFGNRSEYDTCTYAVVCLK
jgi:hypothetical protein